MGVNRGKSFTTFRYPYLGRVPIAVGGTSPPAVFFDRIAFESNQCNERFVSPIPGNFV